MKTRPSFVSLRLVAAASCIVAFAAGCATTNRVALTPAHKTELTATQPLAVVPQQEIGVDINRSNMTGVMGGGLVWAITDAVIDHSRTKKAEGNVTVARDALIDFDFGRTLVAALDQELAGVGWLHAGKCTIQHVADGAAARKLAQNLGASALLIVDTDYRFTSDFGAIALTLQVTIYEKGAKSDAEPIYKNTFYTLWGFPASATTAGGGAVGGAVELWAQNHGKAAREAITQGCTELAAMVAYDLPLSEAANRAAKDGQKRGTLMVQNRLLNVPPLAGTVEKQPGNRVWLRLPSGELVASY